MVNTSKIYFQVEVGKRLLEFKLKCGGPIVVERLAKLGDDIMAEMRCEKCNTKEVFSDV